MKKKLVLCLGMVLSISIMSSCAHFGEADKTVKLDKTIEENKDTNNGVLIAYFSRIGNIDSEYEVDATSSASVVVTGDSILGNTEYMASLIQKEVGGELHFIETKEKYSSHYDSTDSNKLDVQTNEEYRKNARPELAKEVSNIGDYDVVFLGYPNWWSDLPMAVYSFLDEYDLSGKKIYLFNTNGGGGTANTLAKIQELEPNSDVNKNILMTTHFDIGDFNEDDVKEWLDEIEYEKD